MRVRWHAGVSVLCTLLVMLLTGLAASADGYYPREYTDKVTGLSGALKPDLSGRLGGTMPVSPDLQRLPVAYTCGMCRFECQNKWQQGCRGNGCSRAFVGCMEACWWNDCRGGR